MTVSPYTNQVIHAILQLVQKHVFGTPVSTLTPQADIKPRLNSVLLETNP